jgi:hypothetical protein
MAKTAKLIAFCGLAFLMLGCQRQDGLCETGNRVTVAREELRSALVADLRAAKIPVRETRSGELCYPANKADFVRGRLIALDLEQRPANQITITSGRFSVMAFERLQQAGIEFQAIDREGSVLLVFDDEPTAARAFEVIEGVSEVLYGPKEGN